MVVNKGIFEVWNIPLMVGHYLLYENRVRGF